MEYFYETQPVPSPLARRLHFMPPWFHSGSTYTNHVVELLLPAVAPAPLAGTHFRAFTVGGVAQLVPAHALCVRELSFLNVLTVRAAIDPFITELRLPLFSF